MVLRGGWFVLAVMLLRLAQKLTQRRDVQIAESTSGQARCDLLEKPCVAIRVAERSKGRVAAEPGAAVVIFVPNWTEHPDPGGVNWTTRNPLSKEKSASSLHPSFV